MTIKITAGILILSLMGFIAMTDAQFTSLIESIPAIITALGTLVIIILGGLSKLRDAKADAKSEERDKTLTEIHTVTNSNLTMEKAKLEREVDRSANLERLITQLLAEKDATAVVAKSLADKVAPVKASATEVIVVNTPENRVPVEPPQDETPSAKPTKPPTKK